ncbi:glycoside hydrolase family 88 protein [Zasmidium cellare ATCC 36951]|uniref:Glycoside hydrolase family 88 protein n=1 Tax=Zasmidium cellare ATCC 36951 TaxID=1080233 RepID=A0A6A6C3D7_ZASCE|nr:glycoside hydrolase family 88 protein [Zasmidium cellare ATCC 36951]KAF2161423.1 glycoside hydrolase family 88 protein [Zasmidium cellare ATCC 36951]
MSIRGCTLACLILTCSAFQDPRIRGLYDENIEARIWRTILTGAPRIGDVGWPQYTQGAHNNTPSSNSEPGTYVDTDAEGWTAGFFPDSLWQLYHRKTTLVSHRRPYENEPDLDQWLSQTQAWTDPLITNVNLTNTHDIGFLAKPFESALNYNNETKYLPVLGRMSLNLASRYVPAPGVIRSWNTNNDSFSQRGSHEDSVLVIIDNMMNLALLARSASTYTHNETLLEIAVFHANRTRDHHIRPDGSSFHVCDYSGTTGELYLCRTAQGLADNSTWARGQAWAIYGFAEIYSFTGDESYLQTSIQAADWFLEHLPQDGVPFWDFDAPYLRNVTPRDSSAATIAASGLLLLQEQIDNKAGSGGGWHGQGHWNGGRGRRDYRAAAVKLLQDVLDLSLAGKITYSSIGPANPNSTLGAVTDVSTPANTALSRGFESILMHATANNNPNAGDGRSYDTGLVYGDFYLIEAGNRLLEHGSSNHWSK